MKWVVDRIENNIAILENEQTGEKQEISCNLLPINIHESSILVFKEGKYIEDTTYEEKKRKDIEERFKKLRSN